jgi:hypothetical protein
MIDEEAWAMGKLADRRGLKIGILNKKVHVDGSGF